MPCTMEARRGIISPGTGGIDSYELPCECRESNPDPSEEKQMPLITKPSL